MNFQLLEFDTKLFGFKVAKILSQQLSLVMLQSILDELHKKNIRLVYWPSDIRDEISKRAAEKLNGIFCSEQVTYQLDLMTLPKLPQISPEIETYQEKIPNFELEQLAFQAGTYSHFRTDPDFPEKLFFKLYHAWIENSVNGSIATKVFVIQHNNKIAGMITLGIKNNRGDIGLLAVNPDFRKQKLGTKLIHAAQAYFIEEGLTQVQVVTQKANVAACHLYEKCGFKIEKIENFYHFWL